MIQSKTLFAAVAATGLALTVAGLVTAPFNASARAAAGHTDVDVIAERIGGAFASVRPSDVDVSIRAAAVRASKGDRLVPAGCEGETWPSVEPGCLATADGTPAQKVRFVTIGYPGDGAETVLLRVPANTISAR